MLIKRLHDSKVFTLYSAVREVDIMATLFTTEVTTWFLIFENNNWVWVKANEYEPFTDTWDDTGPK